MAILAQHRLQPNTATELFRVPSGTRKKITINISNLTEETAYITLAVFKDSFTLTALEVTAPGADYKSLPIVVFNGRPVDTSVCRVRMELDVVELLHGGRDFAVGDLVHIGGVKSEPILRVKETGAHGSVMAVETIERGDVEVLPVGALVYSVSKSDSVPATGRNLYMKAVWRLKAVDLLTDRKIPDRNFAVCIAGDGENAELRPVVTALSDGLVDMPPGTLIEPRTPIPAKGVMLRETLYLDDEEVLFCTASATVDVVILEEF